MDRRVRFGRKPKLSRFRIAEALARRRAGKPLADIGRLVWCKPFDHTIVAPAFLRYTSVRNLPLNGPPRNWWAISLRSAAFSNCTELKPPGFGTKQGRWGMRFPIGLTLTTQWRFKTWLGPSLHCLRLRRNQGQMQ